MMIALKGNTRKMITVEVGGINELEARGIGSVEWGAGPFSVRNPPRSFWPTEWTQYASVAPCE